MYSNETYKYIFQKLGITNSENQMLFKEVVEEAARYFVEGQKENANKFTEAKETKALGKLARHLNKSKKAYVEISENSKFSIFRFFEGFKSKKIKHKKEKEFLLNYATKNKIVLDTGFIRNLLETLEEVAIEAASSPAIFLKNNKTDLVLMWLWSFSDEWEKFSKVKISEGRYDETESKYVSPAMTVLDELAKPLSISNSQIAEAIKRFRARKETG